MEKVAIEDVDPSPYGDGVDRRRLSGPLDATGIAINHYRLPPGAGFPGGLHAHADQEEVFLVLEGVSTFETFVPASAGGSADEQTPSEGSEQTPSEGSEVTVHAGEAIRFAPGEFQSGRNASAERLVALAIGAPRDTEDVRIPLPCPTCGHDDLRLDASGTRLRLGCPECGAEPCVLV